MENRIPNLDDLLDYGKDYKRPDLIMSDYFRSDNKNENNQIQDDGQSEEQYEDGCQDSGQNEKVDEQPSGQSEEQYEDGCQDSGQNEEVDEQPSEQSEEQYGDDSRGDEQLDNLKDDNDFDELMDNYDKNDVQQNNSSDNPDLETPSDKLNNISTTKIYKVLKKLVSLSYERYEKGAQKYNKKEIVKHYLTHQKFRIADDLENPTFKPDVYVFDLSPSNNEFLQMYVNAISSVAIKGSIIYLTFNNRILRKLEIKKSTLKNIDVNAVATSRIQKYSNFDCFIFDEYRSLYEELKDIKGRKIYIFSDFDISSDISKLSQLNPDIVWFSTEKINDSLYQGYLYREYPTSYIGYYVETFGIEDIEKYVDEKNKSKYKRNRYRRSSK